jgi:hypothetical protein
MPLLGFIVFMIVILQVPHVCKWYAVGVVDEQQTHIITFAICITLPLYYLSLMAFSASVFSYIPATRGGGDYTVGPAVVITLKPGFVPDSSMKDILEQEVRFTPDAPTGVALGGSDKKGQVGTTERPDAEKSGWRTRPCILIEETSTGVFVAAPDDGGGPEAWRRLQSNRPTVTAISREMIAAVRYLTLESMNSALRRNP